MGEGRYAADAVFLCASSRPQRAGDADCGRNCFGRLMPGATVRPFLKMKGDMASRFNVRSARISSPSSGCVIVVPPLAPMRWPWCRCASSPASQEPSSRVPNLRLREASDFLRSVPKKDRSRNWRGVVTHRQSAPIEWGLVWNCLAKTHRLATLTRGAQFSAYCNYPPKNNLPVYRRLIAVGASLLISPSCRDY